MGARCGYCGSEDVNDKDCIRHPDPMEGSRHICDSPECKRRGAEDGFVKPDRKP